MTTRRLSLPQGLLKECNGLGADYLFQQDKPFDVSYDTGDKSLQCGRHVDAFKLWLMWKANVQEDGLTGTSVDPIVVYQTSISYSEDSRLLDISNYEHVGSAACHINVASIL